MNSEELDAPKNKSISRRKIPTLSYQLSVVKYSPFDNLLIVFSFNKVNLTFEKNLYLLLLLCLLIKIQSA